MLIQPNSIIAGTGHRPDKIQAQEEKIREAIRVRLGLYLPHLVISGMAVGFDQWLADEAQKLGFPVCAAIPFLHQEEQWPSRAQRVYHDILAKCRTRYIHHPRKPHDYDHAVRLLQERNEWMVNTAHGVIACWNGDQSGGTINCLRYAWARQKPVDTFNPYEL